MYDFEITLHGMTDYRKKPTLLPATTNTSLFQGDSGDLQTDDSAQALTTSKNTDGDLPNPGPAMNSGDL
jgi:hypothetical protein